MTAEEAVEELLPRSSPEACLAVLAARLPAGDVPPPAGAVVTATIKLIRRAFSALSPDAAFAVLQPTLLPGLFCAFNHPSADVRKGVVACLVDVWALLGTRLDPLLKPLSSSQLKLLTIYLQRRQAGA
jgi:CLIP-associating protein 1/2